jgi:hypothetical protein
MLWLGVQDLFWGLVEVVVLSLFAVAVYLPVAWVARRFDAPEPCPVRPDVRGSRRNG